MEPPARHNLTMRLDPPARAGGDDPSSVDESERPTAEILHRALPAPPPPAFAPDSGSFLDRPRPPAAPPAEPPPRERNPFAATEPWISPEVLAAARAQALPASERGRPFGGTIPMISPATLAALRAGAAPPPPEEVPHGGTMKVEPGASVPGPASAQHRWPPAPPPPEVATALSDAQDGSAAAPAPRWPYILLAISLLLLVGVSVLLWNTLRETAPAPAPPLVSLAAPPPTAPGR